MRPFLYYLILFFFTQVLHAKPPAVMTLEHQKRGKLPKTLKEVSGLAHCSASPNDLWAINDRGNKPRLYRVSLEGELMQTYIVEGTRHFDWEDLSCGRCPTGLGQCLFIGDIGNNERRPRMVQVAWFKLPLRTRKDRLKPETLQLFYPQGAYNAEALLAHPSEPILLIVTKEKATQGKHTVTSIFSIDFRKIKNVATPQALVFQGGVLFHQHLQPGEKEERYWVTGGDFSKDGSWFALVTHDYIYALEWPLASVTQGFPKHEHVWKLPSLPQVESVAIHINQKQIWVASELKKKKKKKPLMLLDIPKHQSF